ncbi:small subunit ribosomal protein S9e [Nematocida sp. AWRm77]|nr:small subunit ribosomal protein S9e [Nematocida sp. AWRm77]
MATPRFSKRAGTPRRPFDKQRLVSEMKYVGEYGLRSKRELRVLEKIFQSMKKRAKDLLIHTDEEYQIVQGRLLLGRLEKQGLMSEIKYTSKKDIIEKLERILDLNITEILERRLQTKVFRLGLAGSIHQARLLIYQKHIAVNGCIVDKPGFIVSVKNDGNIELSQNSALVPGSVKHTKNQQKKAAKAEAAE